MKDVGAARLAGGLIAEVAFGADAPGRLDQFELPRRQDRCELRPGPEVEAALLALAVGVLGGEERAVCRRHVAQHVGEDLARGARVSLVAGRAPGLDRGQREHGLVVEHLLEVGHEPLAVGRVAVKAPADVVPDPAAAHRCECAVDHLDGVGVAGQACVLEQEEQVVRARELRRAAEAAKLGIVAGRKLAGGALGQVGRKLARSGGVRGALEVADDLACRLEQHLAVGAPQLIDARYQLHHPGSSESAALGQVGGGVERPAVRGHQDRERPAAGPGQHLAHRHVDLVDVGSLLAVDLDRHEGTIHERSDLGVLERLVLHHVAPVAGGVADRKEDRLVLPSCRLECLFTPWVPVDGVVGMLEQVGALLAGEPVLRSAFVPLIGVWRRVVHDGNSKQHEAHRRKEWIRKHGVVRNRSLRRGIPLGPALAAGPASQVECRPRARQSRNVVASSETSARRKHRVSSRSKRLNRHGSMSRMSRLPICSSTWTGPSHIGR